MSRTPAFISWDRFVVETASLHHCWVYRGGLESWGPHRSSLERVREASQISSRSVMKLERRLVRDFQRHPEVSEHRCENEDYLGWFALMQHHGAPTRLLDWTYSPFVAAYFAFEAAFVDRQNKPSSRAAPIVWAIDTNWLNTALEKRLPHQDWKLYTNHTDPAGSFSRLFVLRRPAPLQFVGVVTPLVLNERLSIQQGTFLCPGDVRASWSDNFASSMRSGERSKQRSFVFDSNGIPEALERLQTMNLTARSLFPGLDGYARSTGHRAKRLTDLQIKGE
ncbi:MAG: FRG domain-containing protein [Nitrospirales bacterium]